MIVEDTTTSCGSVDVLGTGRVIGISNTVVNVEDVTTGVGAGCDKVTGTIVIDVEDEIV